MKGFNKSFTDVRCVSGEFVWNVPGFLDLIGHFSDMEEGCAYFNKPKIVWSTSIFEPIQRQGIYYLQDNLSQINKIISILFSCFKGIRLFLSFKRIRYDIISIVI